jgi:hypothetical protein
LLKRPWSQSVDLGDVRQIKQKKKQIRRPSDYMPQVTY